MIDITVCILTHNRPKLFDRCINSVLTANTNGYNIEIVVNNDTCDITQQFHKNIQTRYFEFQDEDLSAIYKFLYDQSRGEYIFFLEDDDYIQPWFFSKIDTQYDINFIEYTSTSHLTLGPMKAMEIQRINRTIDTREPRMFVSQFNQTFFQLSQIAFRKNLVKCFPTGNALNNDLKLFQHICETANTLKYINHASWVQTTDGGDNISFTDLNKDERFY